MLTPNEIIRRKKISATMKRLRRTTLPVWNTGKKCPQISKSKIGSIPWNKGTHGVMGLRENHPNWKGGKNINFYGYIRIYKNGKYFLEHRVVMENFLKRKLNSFEHIHHVNGNKTDNKIENLIIISNSEHNHIHFPHGWNPDRKIK